MVIGRIGLEIHRIGIDVDRAKGRGGRGRRTGSKGVGRRKAGRGSITGSRGKGRGKTVGVGKGRGTRESVSNGRSVGKCIRDGGSICRRKSEGESAGVHGGIGKSIGGKARRGIRKAVRRRKSEGKGGSVERCIGRSISGGIGRGVGRRISGSIGGAIGGCIRRRIGRRFGRRVSSGRRGSSRKSEGRRNRKSKGIGRHGGGRRATQAIRGPATHALDIINKNPIDTRIIPVGEYQTDADKIARQTIGRCIDEGRIPHIRRCRAEETTCARAINKIIRGRRNGLGRIRTNGDIDLLCGYRIKVDEDIMLAANGLRRGVGISNDQGASTARGARGNQSKLRGARHIERVIGGFAEVLRDDTRIACSRGSQHAPLRRSVAIGIAREMLSVQISVRHTYRPSVSGRAIVECRKNNINKSQYHR